jgi:hypothetical protein
MGAGGSWIDNPNELGRHDSGGGKGGGSIDSDGTLERARDAKEFVSASRSYRRSWTKKLVDLFFAKRQLSR